ncbi:MAG: hypothetical protein WBA29_02030 [Xanthobacteraceae bacterium]
MRSFPDKAWVEAFQGRVNNDPELAVIGRKFNADIGIAFGDIRYVLCVRSGRIETVIASPRFDVATRFSVRAPTDLWLKFISPNPPPLYHDIFAMIMRVPEFILEGDTLAAMQNARAFHRMMGLMQGLEAGK